MQVSLAVRLEKWGGPGSGDAADWEGARSRQERQCVQRARGAPEDTASELPGRARGAWEQKN